MNKSGLKKVTKTVRGKKGVVKRSYWVRAQKPNQGAAVRAEAPEHVDLEHRLLIGRGKINAAKHGLSLVEKVHRLHDNAGRVEVRAGSDWLPGKMSGYKQATERGGKAQITVGKSSARQFLYHWGEHMDYHLAPNKQGGALTKHDAHARALTNHLLKTATGREAFGHNGTQHRHAVFAEAYVQYVAEKTGDKRLNRELEREDRTSGPREAVRWTREEFVPAHRHFDAILRKHKLTNGGTHASRRAP